MPITLIQSNTPKQRTEAPLADNEVLHVAEFFGDTVQGEGASTGVPSTFLRLKGCTLSCTWCDTINVWREGDPYSFTELFTMMEQSGLIDALRKGQHLILTGGSPLKQQSALVKFIDAFKKVYRFKPFIEVENECVLHPTEDFEYIVDQWNNSPKLANSGMKEKIRYKPILLTHMSMLPNSWFKFVVDCEEDWQEIQRDFLDTELILKEQIILMPCGENQEQLAKTRPIAVEMAIRHNVRFCDRLHVTIWDKKTGV